MTVKKAISCLLYPTELMNLPTSRPIDRIPMTAARPGLPRDSASSLTRANPVSKGAHGSRRAVRSSGESGSALITSIFFLAILLSLIVSLTRTSHLDLRASSNFHASIQNDALIDAGIQHAMAILRNDTDMGQDSLEDDWAIETEAGGTAYPLGDGEYRFEILDAGARLNINTATRDELLTLTGMTEEIADAIIDWRDEDDTPGTQGAESDTYQAYPRPYNAKNGPFETIDELLLVQGITPSLLYGDPTDATQADPTVSSEQSGAQAALADLLTVRSYERNQTAQGTQRLNLNQVTQAELQELEEITLTQQQARAIVDRRQNGNYTSVAELLDVQGLDREMVRQMIDRFTVSSPQTLEGRINVNTASIDVLMTLPQVTEEVANAIVASRSYETVGDLLDESVMTDAIFRAIVNRVCTKSSLFLLRVRAQARPDGMTQAVEALVERQPEEVRLLRRRELARWPGWQSWNWSSENTQATRTTGTGRSVTQ